jgi:hypothetical protein
VSLFQKSLKKEFASLRNLLLRENESSQQKSLNEWKKFSMCVRMIEREEIQRYWFSKLKMSFEIVFETL